MDFLLIATVLVVLYTTPNLGASSDGFYFTVNPNDQDVEEGQPLRLRCAVTPSKDIYYSWLHNGERVDTDQEYGRRYLESESNLQIPHADRELDQGTYQCQALNRSSTFTTASQEAKVNIYWIDPSVQVVLIKPNKFEDIRLGQEVEFACQAKANPPLSSSNIKWYHNGNARLPNTEIRRNGNLRIAVLGVEHTGSYHCRVVHAAGKLDSRPPYVIQFNDASNSELITTWGHEDFTKFVIRGRSVELTCPRRGSQKMVDGIPLITVWGFMQRLGEQQQSVNTLSDVKLVDMDSKLIINNFDVHHANYYTCEVGSHGSPDKSVFLFQVEMATLFAPKRSDFSPRLKKNQPYVVKIGSDAELRYYPDYSPSNSFLIDQVSHPTPQIQWRKKGDQQTLLAWPTQTQNEHDLMPLTDDPTSPRVFALRGRHLVVKRASESDAGIYEMWLSNVAGRMSIVFDLLVTFPPEFYQPQAHEEHSLDEDEPLTLNCGIKRRAIPGSTAYWEKDQRVLKTYENSLITIENNGEVIRFPQLKPEDQGQYQCFIQTEGYKKRAAGREQTVLVKAKLQFLREIRQHFLEVNTIGRIPCKARGYGSLNVDWFHKVGSRSTDLLPIRPPNQVEPGGTLVIQYVSKADAGEYVCRAQSTYKNAQINMTVNVVVGEKPQISHISGNQTVRVGGQLVLNCHATGDPSPQISWIAKRAGFVMYVPQADPVVASSAIHTGIDISPISNGNSSPDRGVRVDSNPTSDLSPDPMMAAILVQNMPTDKGRVTAFTNGSLVISQANLVDQAEYICVANNKHAVETRQGLFVRVLTAEEYARRQLGGEGSESGILRTILTVVGCAVTYLGLIVALTVFCSMRMVRKRSKRSPRALKITENGQLLNPLGEPNGMAGVAHSTTVCSGNTPDTGYLLAGMGSATGTSGKASYAPVSHCQQQTFTNNVPCVRNGSNYTDANVHLNAPPHLSPSPNAMGSASSQIPSSALTEAQEWWPWKTHGYFNPVEMQQKVPHGTPASPFDVTSESAADKIGSKFQAHVTSHPLNGNPCSYLYNYHNLGTETSTTATTASEPQLMSAPPPTPLDSRSHFSGLSSGNSTSLYSRSLLSGASNMGSNGIPNVSEVSPVYGLPNGNCVLGQMDRMHYPRCELKVEGVLGKGIFGDVFLARACHIQDEESQSLVLVKSLTSHEASHINEFHRQLELFGKLNHEHVARLLGICMEQEPFYMLLEYCEWGDLKMFLRRFREGDTASFKQSTLGYGQKLKMCHQIAVGMESLSQMHCIHRDLAARNILLTQDMELKISSLGLCRGVYAGEYYRLPQTDQFIPLRWFAPELIIEALPSGPNNSKTNQLDYGHMFAGPSLPYSIQSDVWAFAVVVCEIFSLATLPLARLTDQEIIAAGRKTAVQGNLMQDEDLSKEKSFITQAALKPDVPAEIPPELSDILNCCWSPATRKRPDFRELSTILRDLIS